MTGLLADTLRLAGAGRTAHALAGELGVGVDLVAAILEEAERLGLAEQAGTSASCHGCAALGTARGAAPGAARGAGSGRRRLPLACAGCPLAR